MGIAMNPTRNTATVLFRPHVLRSPRFLSGDLDLCVLVTAEVFVRRNVDVCCARQLGSANMRRQRKLFLRERPDVFVLLRVTPH